jgi:hypothetical protein
VVGALRTHNIFGHNLVGHLHLGMHGSDHDGMVLLGVWSFILPVLICVKQFVVGMAFSVLASTCIALLCCLVLRLFMCLFVQHDSKWRDVSICCDVHRLYKGRYVLLKDFFLSFFLSFCVWVPL